VLDGIILFFITLIYVPQPLLSVLTQLLNESSFETNKILPFLVSAFPDLKPWQVCMAAGKSQKGKENYYEYLSTLLDPLYGDPSARQDKGLVQVSMYHFKVLDSISSLVSFG